MDEELLRDTIQELLIATNQFDQGAVLLTGLPEDYGQGASEALAVAIQPNSTRISDLWDAATEGGIVYECTIDFTFMYRDNDPVARDKGCARLFKTAANTLNGVAIVPGFILPDKTRFQTWAWQKEVAPERRIKATFLAVYEIDGWDSLDTSD